MFRWGGRLEPGRYFSGLIVGGLFVFLATWLLRLLIWLSCIAVGGGGRGLFLALWIGALVATYGWFLLLTANRLRDSGLAPWHSLWMLLLPLVLFAASSGLDALTLLRCPSGLPYRPAMPIPAAGAAVFQCAVLVYVGLRPSKSSP